ncbi:hypothetical protein EGM70_09180 [Enterobacteriaceae bacterium 89]|nr:hypothetical protein [Enterobacteriaceae bacterium 89]
MAVTFQCHNQKNRYHKSVTNLTHTSAALHTHDYIRHISSCRGVGCTHSPQSLTKVSSWG